MARNKSAKSVATEPQTELPSVTPKKKQEQWLVIGLIILLVFSLGSTAYLAYQNSLLRKQLSSIETPKKTFSC